MCAILLRYGVADSIMRLLKLAAVMLQEKVCIVFKYLSLVYSC